MESNVDVSQNIFKILVATDIHLGYMEKDAERSSDSFNSFEEILEMAVSENVDFILLGGDLFHENKPSRNSFLRCMELLKKYTFGDRQVNFNFVSDPSVNFSHLKSPTVNYLDPNLNISIPVFSINGNHDDPSGLGQHSPLEMLSATGLINYFGRIENLNEINISPLLLEKGKTKIALYGLSSVKDERLYRLFRENKVRMYRPVEDIDSWFNILVLHQNHTKHSLTNYIPEEFLDVFLNLVIWGHEHECLIQPRKSSDDGFFVIQPGSSVATSLCAGEAVPKHIGILEVDSKKKMRITPRLLKTVRPFIFEDISLSDFNVPKRGKDKQSNPYEEIVEEHVKEMIERAKELISGHPKQPTKPLIRLRIEYTDESQMFNVNRFGFKFTDKVANPDSIVLFRKFRKESAKMESGVGIDAEAMDAVFNEASLTKVEDLVEKYFEELEGSVHQLQLLSERGLAHAVNQFVEKDYREAIDLIFKHQVTKTVNHLKSIENFDVDYIEDAIEEFYQKRLEDKVKEEEEAISAFKTNENHVKNGNNEDDDVIIEEISDDDIEIEQISTRGAHAGRRGRGSRTSRGSKRGQSAANKTKLQIDNTLNQSVPRGSGRSRGLSTSTRNTRAKNNTTLNTSNSVSIKDFFQTSTRIGNARRNKGAAFDSESDTD